MISFRLILLWALSVVAGSTNAQPYEGETVFAKGAWRVELTHNTSTGSLWCAAETSNNAAQSMSVIAYDNSTLAFFLIDHDWNLQPRSVKFLLDIDYSRWTMTGSADGIGVSLNMKDVEKSVTFLTELQKGRAVAIYTAQGERLATFSLSGSFAAITSLFECWEAIAPNQDPFGNDADPFGSSADPFN
ncbi:hypothetical protein [uncultured Tateyamaria sp.]|uniref:hypothetical protein n=1 Tax=uncultured Tateyamaria sp. TaxID=455651 RepID=UPI002616B789|nr:hypothetical protein [uncultured Tateyamaria sp.]